jgi:hypothetical protein
MVDFECRRARLLRRLATEPQFGPAGLSLGDASDPDRFILVTADAVRAGDVDSEL